MRRRFYGRLLFGGAMVLAAWVGCSDQQTSGGPTDGGQDASTDARKPRADGGIEAEAAAPDATRDALVPDPNPFTTGTWLPVPGIPSTCKLFMSPNPEVWALEWIPCTSGRAGCRMVDTNWSALPGLKLRSSIRPEPTRLVGGKPYFRIRRYWPAITSDPWEHMLDVIEPLDGPPVFAMGGPKLGCPYYTAVGDYGVGYYVMTEYQPEEAFIVGAASWADIKSFSTQTFPQPDAGLYPSVRLVALAMGAHGVWATTEKPLTIVHLDAKTKARAYTTPRALAESPSGISDGALFFHLQGQGTIDRMKEDGSWTTLVTPTPPHQMTSRAHDRSNAADEQLVWFEGDYYNTSIWVASLSAASEASLVRREVARYFDPNGRGGADAVANRGVVLFTAGRDRVRLVRLSDGKGWEIQADPKTRITTPTWVDDDDVFFETAPDDPPGQVDRDSENILRISRSTLGPPTLPSGL